MSDTFIVDESGVRPASMDEIFCTVCGYCSCICKVSKEHREGCRYLTAMRCPVGVECEHGFDVCPVCDPCTCKEGVQT